MVFSLTSCGVDTSDMKIDYGKSEIYTKDDVDAAIEVILDEVNTWFAIDKIYSFSYVSYEHNSEYDIVGYANELADSIGHEPNFDQAIELESRKAIDTIWVQVKSPFFSKQIYKGLNLLLMESRILI